MPASSGPEANHMTGGGRWAAWRANVTLASVCVGLLQDDKVKHFFLFSLSLSFPLKSATILRFSADMHTQKLPQACESQYVIQFFSQSAIITIQPPGQS